MDKLKNMASNFKDSETGKTGNAGVMAEGKQRLAEYKQDKADGSVNWAQEGKDAMKDWKPQGGAAPAAPQ
ncbi:hypothetical protein WJX82_004572 [Trebouxia sp. C0006]